MKFNPLFAVIGALVLGVAMLGFVLLARPFEAKPKIAGPTSSPAQFAQAEPTKAPLAAPDRKSVV